ncbi:hypothetical protein, partial [Helicobacter sp.]|uniref:hypothetical protein n=1 Tax=Helicobacter sp. TaxID=218 RepID=UPI00388E5D78
KQAAHIPEADFQNNGHCPPQAMFLKNAQNRFAANLASLKIHFCPSRMTEIFHKQYDAQSVGF